MTGNDLYKRTLGLLGYLNSNMVSANKDNLLKRATDIINQICFDLKLKTISELENTIVATSERLDALCYGVAMLLAVSEGETEKNKLFAQIYNAKRAAVLCETQSVEDKLPSVSYGDD